MSKSPTINCIWSNSIVITVTDSHWCTDALMHWLRALTFLFSALYWSLVDRHSHHSTIPPLAQLWCQLWSLLTFDWAAMSVWCPDQWVYLAGPTLEMKPRAAKSQSLRSLWHLSRALITQFGANFWRDENLLILFCKYSPQSLSLLLLKYEFLSYILRPIDLPLTRSQQRNVFF